jgi:hypothetical protein
MIQNNKAHTAADQRSVLPPYAFLLILHGLGWGYAVLGTAAP